MNNRAMNNFLTKAHVCFFSRKENNCSDALEKHGETFFDSNLNSKSAKKNAVKNCCNLLFVQYTNKQNNDPQCFKIITNHLSIYSYEKLHLVTQNDVNYIDVYFAE